MMVVVNVAHNITFLTIIIIIIVCSNFHHHHHGVNGFSLGPLVSSDTSWDRFVAVCPADEACIRHYDASLLSTTTTQAQQQQQQQHLQHDHDHNDGIWVAVYRSNHNMPSVVVARDQLWAAMDMATTTTTTTTTSTTMTSAHNPSLEQKEDDDAKLISTTSRKSSTSTTTTTTTTSTASSASAPVAVARLRPSPDFDNTWLLDSMRCVLKKEHANDDCDGGSEHAEAIAVAIDTLFHHHLRTVTSTTTTTTTSARKDFAIRSKATLVSAKLLEERGFVPVEDLARDMCSHVLLSIDDCLARYANRAVNAIQYQHHEQQHQQYHLPPKARDIALQIVSLLGQLQSSIISPEQQQSQQSQQRPPSDEDDYWSNMGKIKL